MSKFFFPTWKGWLLINPMRRLFQPPSTVLGPYVRPDMTVLDVGASMGYFTLPLAEMVGPKGTVIAVDCDARQLEVLARRARRANVADRIQIRHVADSLTELALPEESVDLVVLLQVLHYMNDPRSAVVEAVRCLRQGGRVVLGEPKAHLSESAWRATVRLGTEAGLSEEGEAQYYNLRVVVLDKVSATPTLRS